LIEHRNNVLDYCFWCGVIFLLSTTTTTAALFVNSASEVQDAAVVTVAILNPMMYSISTGQNNILREITNILEYRDDYGSEARTYRNATFLLVAEESSRQALFVSTQKLVASGDE
jgi:1-aminocyclopropane-1-carboxylate deaminase/D-cysteine desulfhydrase-like pyridoxal-dependent ACC family enzyme